MSLIKHKVVTMSRAETKFREAFERLKTGKTELVPTGTKMSQNAVAKEAGVIPSALRPSRFPDLCREIAEWIDEHKDDPAQKSGRQKNLAERNARRAVREQMRAMKVQRDLALSKLLSAEAHILELTMEVRRLRALAPDPVVPIRPADRGKAAGTKPKLRSIEE
ncbi:hypothetical protein [Lysobacter sp. H23M47]|uniref:hypothetical protein n=1 Tax=Lysobacter sp. H23M47 TaxID=2781024 RepID=UPI001880E532|nr:hypothetical protein [Lysobacter sp. H23M47]QOW24683.1 hypothetical protein INQ43_00835 [Lysobacter sp. H23M47]